MGDSGSLFLGFLLGVIPFLGTSAGGSSRVQLGLLPSITILALPVVDTLRVMRLRLLQGKSPMNADRQHVHHLLFDSGYSALKVDSILSLVAACLAIVVLVAAMMPQSIGYVLEFIAMGVLLIFFRYAKYVRG